MIMICVIVIGFFYLLFLRYYLTIILLFKKKNRKIINPLIKRIGVYYYCYYTHIHTIGNGKKLESKFKNSN